MDTVQYKNLYYAYTWLRRVEHILQLKEMQQLHSLPTSKEGRTHIAIHMGYLQKLKASPLEQFEIALKEVKTIVLDYHNKLFPDLL